MTSTCGHTRQSTLPPNTKPPRKRDIYIAHKWYRLHNIIIRFIAPRQPPFGLGPANGNTPPPRPTDGETRGRSTPVPSSPTPLPSPSSWGPLQGTSLHPFLSTTFMLNPTELTRYRRSSCPKHASIRSRASSRVIPSWNPLSRRLSAKREARPWAPKGTF